MTTTINASTSSGLVNTADTSGILKVQSNGKTTNALAWINFDGTVASPTARASYNVTSITKNTTGDYTITFTTAMTDANYAICGFASSMDTSTGHQWAFVTCRAQSEQLTTSSRITCSITYTATQFDSNLITVSYFGN